MLQGRVQSKFDNAKRFALLAGLILLQACSGSSEEEPSVAASTPPGEAEYDVDLSGSVGDGPIINSDVRVIAKDGTVITSTVSDTSAGYNIQFKTKGKYYPLTIDSTGGTDLATNLAPGFTLVSAVTEPRAKAVSNLSPFSTVGMAAAAQMSGGLTSSNISTAMSYVMSEFNSGLTSSLSIDPMTVPIDDSNLAEIVKSSESAAEVLRRTQRALGQPGVSVDDVVNAIGGDIADGVLDGNGSGAVDRRVSALTVIASAQVMLESITNQLQVNGQDVTPILDGIVQQLASGPNPDLTASRPVTAQMIAQAKRGVAAAIQLAGTSPELQTLSTSLDSLTPGMSAASASQALPSGSWSALDSTLAEVGTASDAELGIVLGEQAGPSTPPSNAAPIISGTPPTSVMQDTAYTFTPTATDADGDALSFLIDGQPTWTSFNEINGTLSGMPGSGDVGTHGSITISVTDGIEMVSLESFTITVESTDPPPPGNTPPVISGTPPVTAIEDTFYRFTPTASDVDNDNLSFSATGLPSWANFSATTGTVSGTPRGVHVGTTDEITISVSDGAASASLTPFSITVEAAPNSAPVISGTPPATAQQDSLYTFTPEANDPDGDQLSFVLDGQLGWATVDPDDGTLSGTPDASDVGTYDGLMIVASDGVDEASLGPFSITVEVVSSGSATLSWTPPTLNDDGSMLSNLAGYNIYWGQSPGSYTSSVYVDNPGISTYVVENLAPGTYYFSITAENDLSLESEFSNEASKTINPTN